MSADKRRKILVVFAGLAVVLVGVIAYISPNFRNDNVSGAIGAVQKHREPQIAQQDVILGDEKVREEQRILFGDFLADAASLRSLGVEAALAARATPDAQARLASVETAMAGRRAELQSRYAAEMQNSLGIIAILIGSDELAQKKLEAIRAEVASKKLNAADMEALNSQLASMLNSLSRGAKSIHLQNVESLAAARTTLKDMEAQYAARLAEARLRSQEAYLQAVAQEAQALEAKNAPSLMAEEFALAAQKLEARALGNMLGVKGESVDKKHQPEIVIESMRKSLASFEAQLAARKTGSEAELAAFRADVAAFSRKLESDAAEAAARTTAIMQAQLRAIDAQLGARDSMNARLASIDAQVAAKLRNDSALAAYKDVLEAMNTKGNEANLASMLGKVSALQARER